MIQFSSLHHILVLKNNEIMLMRHIQCRMYVVFKSSEYLYSLIGNQIPITSSLTRDIRDITNKVILLLYI